MSAHFLGIIIREQFKKKEVILFTVNLLAFTGVLIAIAYFRGKFFEASDFQKVLGIHMDVLTVTIVFVLIQAFIFIFATTASYFAHDPHPYLRRAKKEFEDAKRKFEKISRDTDKAEERADNVAELLVKIDALRENTFKKYRNKAGEIKAIQERIIETYRTHNLRNRDDYPVSFKNYPTIDVPKSLQELDIDCGLTDDLEGQNLR